MISIVQDTTDQFGFDPSITLNPLLPHVLEAVVSLDFVKRDATNAHNCIRTMQKLLIKSWHIPYRTNIKDMDLYFEDNTYLDYLKGLKKVFDPDNIISPGRYLPNDR